METRAYHVLIGFFTVLMVAAALSFALWMGSANHEKNVQVYDVLFDEAVSGLSEGSAVEFKGIRVGSVKTLRIDPADTHRIRVRISVDSDAPVYDDTHARLVTAAISGLSTIRLMQGTGQRLRPANGEIPVIPAEVSSMDKLLSGSEDIVTNVNLALLRFQNLFSDENLASIHRSLENIENATAMLADERESLHATLTELVKVGKHANVALAEASQVMRSAHSLVDVEGRGSLASAQRSMDSLEHTIQSLDNVIAENRAPLNASLNGLTELGPALAELRATLASMRNVSRQLEERPANYLLGLESTREFKP